MHAHEHHHDMYVVTELMRCDAQITHDQEGNDVPARLWTSTLVRTKETAQFIATPTLTLRDAKDPLIEYEWKQMKAREWHHLDELFAGVYL